jgi:Flp pilus assembly protein TadD
VLLDLMGKILEQQAPARLGEAIGYYRAARGQRRQLGIALSKALLRASRPSQAEEVLQELVRLQPDNAATWFCLGNVLDSRQKRGEAEAAYRKAADLRPDFAEAQYNLGIALQRQFRFDAAAVSLKKGLRALLRE